MTLRYRGAEYSAPNTQIQFVEEVIGQYRGATLTRRVAQDQTANRVDGLVYRGAKVK
ncbi:MAG: DUF4278 domain-containing protein [Leptolyngbyaceae cyanobacterium]